MIKPEMIPDEALEAAARAAYETPIPGASSWGEKPWEEVDGMLREYFVWQASAAIAASLNAWPGVDYRPGAKVTKTWRDPGKIILPLPQESSDD